MWCSSRYGAHIDADVCADINGVCVALNRSIVASYSGGRRKKSFVFPFHCVKSGIVSFFDSTRYCVFPLCCLFVVTTLPRGTLTAWNFPLYRITCYAMLGLRHQSINIVERPIEGGARSRMNVFTRPMGFLLLSKHEIYCCQRCARTRGPSTATTKAGTSLAERERPRFCIGKPVPFIVWYRSHGGMARGIKMKLLVALVYIRNLVPGQEEEAAFLCWRLLFCALLCVYIHVAAIVWPTSREEWATKERGASDPISFAPLSSSFWGSKTRRPLCSAKQPTWTRAAQTSSFWWCCSAHSFLDVRTMW